MRVAIVYDCLYPATTGGGERVYRKMADLLIERGAQVDYLTRALPNRDSRSSTGLLVVPVWSGEIYDSSGRRTTRSAVGFGFAIFRALVRRRRDYDLVISSALPVLTLLAARCALLGSRVRLVADWLEVWSWSKWREYAGACSGTLGFVLQCIGARTVKESTVNSSFTAVGLRRYNGNRPPTILGLVDLDEDPGVQMPASEPAYLLFAGRHIADKHIDALPGALARARERYPELRLVVTGSGPETSTLTAALERLYLSDESDVLGWVDDAKLAELMASASALVNPSSREGFGLIVVEAARYGTPSVVVEGPDNAAAELVVEGINGAIAGSRAPQQLGDAILGVLDGGTALRRSTREWFVVERRTRGLAASVDAILANHASAV